MWQSIWSRAGRHTWEPAFSVWEGRPVVTCLEAGLTHTHTHTHTHMHTQSVAKQTNYPRWGVCDSVCVCVCVGRRTLHQHPVTHKMFIQFVKIIFPQTGCQGGCLLLTHTHLGEGSPIPTAWSEMEALSSILLAGSFSAFLFVTTRKPKVSLARFWICVSSLNFCKLVSIHLEIISKCVLKLPERKINYCYTNKWRQKRPSIHFWMDITITQAR